MAALSDANCTTKKGALKRAKTCLSTLLKRFQKTALGNTVAPNEEKEEKGKKGDHQSSSPFLFGKVSSADAVLAGLLYAVFESDISRNELQSLLRADFPVFESYYRAMTTTFLDPKHDFPDFAAQDAAAASRKGGLNIKLKGAEEWVRRKTGLGIHVPVPSFETAQMASFTVLTAACVHVLIRNLVSRR